MAALQIADIPEKIRTQYDIDYEDRVLQKMTEIPRQSNRNAEDVKLLKFPSTKNILWDHACIGRAYTLHISCYRKPKLCISEKILRFIQRHAESKGPTTSCVLVGTMNIDDDGEGVVLTVERMDPVLDPNSSSSHAAGDMLIPFTVQKGCKDRSSSVDDYSTAIQLLKQRCCSKDPVELANFLLTKGWCSFYPNGDNCVHHLEFDMVTMATEIKATPISPVPIVPTALSKNLAGPMSISHMQGTPKTGYLTMDHTRKLLLVLESDPKVVTLPLVGIWVSGVNEPYSPFVWASCLRYLYNSSIQDRVCCPPDPFLLVLYNPTHSKPEFYECAMSTGSSNMCFDIYSGYEAVQLDKSSSSSCIVEVTMEIMSEGQKLQQFDEAVRKTLPQLSSDSPRAPAGRQNVRAPSPDSPSQEDCTPRLKPAPYTSKQTLAQSLVPEVSLFFGENDTFVPNLHHPGISSSQPTAASQGQQNIHSKNTSVPNFVSSAYNLKNSNMNSVANKQSIQTSNENESNVHKIRPLAASVPTVTSYQQSPVHQMASSVPQPSHQSEPQPQCQPRPSAPTFSTGYAHPQHPPTSTISQRPPICNCPSCPRPPSAFHPGAPHMSARAPVPGQRFLPPAGYRNPGPARYAVPAHGYPSHTGPGMMQPPHNAHIPASTAYPYTPDSHLYPPSSYVQHHPANIGQPPYPVSSGFQQFQDGVIRSSSSQNGPVISRQGTMAHNTNSVPVPQASGGLPTIAEARNLSPKTPVQSNDYQTSQEGIQHRLNNNSDNSGRSSDDSGLSFTPEKNNSPSTANVKQPQQQQHVLESSSSTSKSAGLDVEASGVNWDNIPPEIYQLLLKQDQQLKQLQAQIQVLTSQSLNTSAGSQAAVSKAPVLQTAATNTSMQLPEPREQVSACMQTSLDSAFHDASRNSVKQLKQQTRPRSQDMSHSSSGSNGEGAGQTPYEIRHRGKLPMNSTQRDDAELDISQGELVALMNNMHECTIDSVQSEMIVDLPSFQSSPTRSPRSQESYSESTTFNMSPRSPVSASMCDQGRNVSGYSDDDEEEEENNTAGTDNPEYYTKLMDNIKKLLSRDTTEQTEDMSRDGYEGDMSSDPSTPVTLAKQDINLGAHLQSFIRMDPSRPSNDTTFIPKINYVSMFLDSDTDTSLEINAMAMKYLKDEQLTQLTKLQAKNKLTKDAKNGAERTALLQRILRAEEDHTPNVTTLGMSANDLTFATKQYMEKHGLLDTGALNGSSTSTNHTYNDTYQLKTNYSTVSSTGSDYDSAQVTHEILGSSSNKTDPSSLQSTPTGRYQLETFDRSRTNGQVITPVHQEANPGAYGTPRPHHSQRRTSDYRRFSPASAQAPGDGTDTYLQNGSPFTQKGVQNRDSNRINRPGGYVSPQITPAPTARKPSTPVSDGTPQYQMNYPDRRRENDGFAHQQGYGDPPVKQRAGEAAPGNYYSTRQHREETNEDDRILDITRLKQLPKLL